MNYDRIVKVVRVLLIGVVSGIVAVALIVSLTYKKETLIEIGLLPQPKPQYLPSDLDNDYKSFMYFPSEMEAPKVTIAPTSMRSSDPEFHADLTNITMTLVDPPNDPFTK
jgi:hypothetical protein